MSKQRTTTSKVLSWLTSLVLIAGAIWLYYSRQTIIDLISYHQYTPTADIERISQEAQMTDAAEYMFYVTHPAVENSESFNQNCERKEADSPILGCYTGTRIHVFNVTDDRLEGIKAVTAAHEMLHAVYDRLSDAEKNRLKTLLEAEYAKIQDPDLKSRMEYYARTQPGQSVNELHSIIGTEHADVSPELESYYAKYFKDRAKLVALHTKVESIFSELSVEASALSDRIETLADSINADTASYNQNVEALNESIESFNQRARSNGGFSTQSEFEAARASLVERNNALANQKNAVETLVTEYRRLVAQLTAINGQAAALNRSIDSTLSDTPTI